MKLIQYFFQRRMVIILILVFILINLFTKNYQHYGINKTVGLAYNITEFSPLIFLFTFYIFLFIYGILALSKKETNLAISIVHTIMIIVSAILLENSNNGFLMIFNCISIIVFILNMFKSLKTHKVYKAEV